MQCFILIMMKVIVRLDKITSICASGSKTWQLSEINGNAGVFTIKNATNSQDILNIDGVNQVGVNDTTPDATLSVGGSTAFMT